MMALQTNLRSAKEHGKVVFMLMQGGKGGYGQMWRGKAVPSQGFSTVNGE